LDIAWKDNDSSIDKQNEKPSDKKQLDLKVSTLGGTVEPFVDTFVEYNFPKKKKKLTKPDHFREWFKHLRTNWKETIDDDMMKRRKNKYDQEAWMSLVQSGLVKKDEDGEYRFVE